MVRRKGFEPLAYEVEARRSDPAELTAHLGFHDSIDGL